MRGAVIVGVDHYDFGGLKGCIKDAFALSEALVRDEFNKKNFDIELLVSNELGQNITQKTLRQSLERLFKVNSEVALFYFSGHGTVNTSGGYIVTQDAQKYSEGISLSEILHLANESNAGNRIIILDCCHSGSMGGLPTLGTDMAILKKGVTILTSNSYGETSATSDEGGIFTRLLIQALQGGAADILGKVSIASVYSYLDQALGFFNQRPMLKSHVSELVSLRDCKPALEMSVLHKITDYFYNDDHLFQLDPTYESSYVNSDHEKVIILSHLQQYRDARLLLPVGESHMYDAVMASKTCKLTAQGKYYWYLVKYELI